MVEVQRQTIVTDSISRKQFLLFPFAWQYYTIIHNIMGILYSEILKCNLSTVLADCSHIMCKTDIFIASNLATIISFYTVL